MDVVNDKSLVSTTVRSALLRVSSRDFVCALILTVFGNRRLMCVDGDRPHRNKSNNNLDVFLEKMYMRTDHLAVKGCCVRRVHHK